MLILPAIDIFEGKCVRLRQGDYAQKTVYESSPAEVARQFADYGFSFIHIVDLEGAKEKKVVNWKTLESISALKGIHVEIGGGIRTTEDIRRLLDAGASRVVIGSIAAKSPDLAETWIQEFTADRIVVGMDVKNGSVAISGWTEDSRCEPMNFISGLAARGAKTFICTDISRDGMLDGVNKEFFGNLKSTFPGLAIIASGGISTMTDLQVLKTIGVSAVIVGKALYEGRISLAELAQCHGATC